MSASRDPLEHVPASNLPTQESELFRVSADDEVAGIDSTQPAARSGEDSRRRGWFWHWNAIVTQFAPLVGLKGVGLLNSYTVWTDRREESPHRGYAFPSQQSEADFYGEDRSELITINKILVELDLIEIRKEMVLRVDEAGRRWRVPHNLYRVKDRDDGFSLTAAAVDRVVHLADRDKTVYRYIRHIFSPRFKPIDSNNVWATILDDLRPTPIWARLADRAAQEDARASARTKAGHRSRKASAAEDPMNPGAPAAITPNDSAAVKNTVTQATTVAVTNKGLVPDVAPANNGSDVLIKSSVAPANEAVLSDVAPSNTTYNQEKTTTTTLTGAPQNGADNRALGPPSTAREQLSFGPAGAIAPADKPGHLAALRAFAEANGREPTLAEQKLLRDLAERFELAARTADQDGMASGWQWITAAIYDAVDAGSSYVATRRVREILARWERDGLPGGENHTQPAARARHRSAQKPLKANRLKPVNGEAVTSPHESSQMRVKSHATMPPPFLFEENGLSSSQLWQAILEDLEQRDVAARANVDAWLRPAAIVGRNSDGALVIGAPNETLRRRIESRYATAIASAASALLGTPVVVTVVAWTEWLASSEFGPESIPNDDHAGYAAG
ncbi:hypothetical protein BH23CHL5_BH23CHL5_27700 [soil metagenome]